MQVQLVSSDRHPTVQLTNGKFHAAGDPASPDYADVSLLPSLIALGDLNGDGLGDAAFLLAENYGGSGVFVSLVAALNAGGKPAQAGASLIDDRPDITALEILDQRIMLTGSIHGPNDPGCCAALPVSETFGLSKMGLVRRRLTTVTQEGTQRSISIENPFEGSQVPAGSVEVKGSLTGAPFENTLTVHVYDDTGKELMTGSIPASIASGQAGSFNSTIDLSAVPADTGVLLEVSDVSAADGSTLAMDSVELVIK